MIKKEDVSNSLRPRQICNDHVYWNKVIVMIQETMNPFDVNLDPDKLYNTGKGLAAIDSTQNFLLNVFENGENERKKFIEECSQDSRRFKKPNQRQKIISFTTATGKQKITTSEGKVLSACLMHDLFGSILYKSLQRKVDIAQVLQYPLIHVPLSSLSHVDGTTLSTPKAALLT